MSAKKLWLSSSSRIMRARTVTCRMFNFRSFGKLSEAFAKHEALLPPMLRNLKHAVCQIGRWLSNARLDKVTPAKALPISQPRHHASALSLQPPHLWGQGGTTPDPVQIIIIIMCMLRWQNTIGKIALRPFLGFFSMTLSINVLDILLVSAFSSSSMPLCLAQS